MAPQDRRRPVGSHVRAAGGLARTALATADRIGAEAVQVLVGSPRGWAPSPGDPEQDAAFRAGCAARRLPAFVHAPYLVNLGSPTPQTADRSVAALAHALRRAHEIGARAVVVHAGSAVDGRGRDAALRQLRATVDELGPHLDALGRHPRVGVCLDTCHAFAAGHDLASPGGMRRLLDDVVREAGRGRLRLVHANDSLDVVVETPGGPAAHAHDVALLEGLRDR